MALRQPRHQLLLNHSDTDSMESMIPFIFPLVVAFAFTTSSCNEGRAGNNREAFVQGDTLIDDTNKSDATQLLQKDSTIIKNETPHEGFVYAKTLIPDLVEELRYATDNNFMGTKAGGYECNRVILTESAAIALKAAADEFREMGYVVKIYDAYRPQRVVTHFVRWSQTSDQKNKADYYPTLNKSKLFPTYIARKSGHSRGSTVDMTICHKDTGKEVDMGGHFDYFGPPSHPDFMGKYEGGNVTKQNYENRMLLKNVMLKHGFKAYSNEWWHFTLLGEPYPNTYFDFPVK